MTVKLTEPLPLKPLELVCAFTVYVPDASLFLFNEYWNTAFPFASVVPDPVTTDPFDSVAVRGGAYGGRLNGGLPLRAGVCSDGAMKKLINEPGDVVSEALRGMAAAHPDRLRVDHENRIVYRKDAPIRFGVKISRARRGLASGSLLLSQRFRAHEPPSS